MSIHLCQFGQRTTVHIHTTFVPALLRILGPLQFCQTTFMRLPSLLYQVKTPQEIRAYFDWHSQQRVPLLLLSICSEGPASATLLGSDDECVTLDVRCTGLSELSMGTNVAYAVIGSTRSGANFLASGQMGPKAGTKDCFQLSFPQWIDVSQSRDSFRCRTPGGHSLRFSTLDLHLNDVVCRVENVSLGGVAVEWGCSDGCPPALNGVTEEAMLQTRDSVVPLGRLRVAHVTPQGKGCVIGLDFEQRVPREFCSLVLDAQRSHYLA
jgi:hypothetical protein